MSAGIVSFAAIVALVAAVIATVHTRKRYGKPHLFALVAGLVSGLVLTASALVLIEDWPQIVNHYDFAAFNQQVNGKYQGQFYAVLFFPYEAAASGAFAAVVFSRWLYFAVRYDNIPG